VREFALSVAYGRSGLPCTVNGVTFKVEPSMRWSFPASHDPEVAAFLDTKLKPGMCCWNVGANVGIHVLQLAHRVGAQGSVVAFEPNPAAVALLRRHVELNGYDDRVTIVQAAVGEREGETEFFVAGADPMGRADRPNPLLPQTTRISVPVITLDGYLKSQTWRPDCILMDIEGWEIGALRGGRTILELQPFPIVIVELHPDAWEWSGHSRQDLETLLREHKLSVKPLSGQDDPLELYGRVVLYRPD
jgi:FkbM family methyltransferase